MVIVWLLVCAAAGAAFLALVLWGTSGSPTRPRPGSRHRGSTLTDVDRRLRRRRRR